MNTNNNFLNKSSFKILTILFIEIVMIFLLASLHSKNRSILQQKINLEKYNTNLVLNPTLNDDLFNLLFSKPHYLEGEYCYLLQPNPLSLFYLKCSRSGTCNEVDHSVIQPTSLYYNISKNRIIFSTIDAGRTISNAYIFNFDIIRVNLKGKVLIFKMGQTFFTSGCEF